MTPTLASSSEPDVRHHRVFSRLVFGRSSAALLIIAGLTAVYLLQSASHPNGLSGLAILFVMPLGLIAVAVWLGIKPKTRLIRPRVSSRRFLVQMVILVKVVDEALRQAQGT